MARLAIAIVHYQAEALLAECLQRLVASDMTDFRACVVDCGSHGGLADAMPGDDRFTLVEPGANLGYAAGINRAFGQLPPDSPFLLCLNPDVLVDADTLGHVLALLESRPDAGAATCRLTLPSGALDPACRRSDPTLFSAFCKFAGLQRLFPNSPRFGRYNLTWMDPDIRHEVDSASGAFLLLRREALAAADGQMDERFFLYGEDLDLCRRIRRAGYRVIYTPGAEALHIKGSGRIRPWPVTREFYRAMWIYYRKWGRHRSNPAVLAMLLPALVVLAAGEGAGNAVRRFLHGQDR